MVVAVAVAVAVAVVANPTTIRTRAVVGEGEAAYSKATPMRMPREYLRCRV